MEWDPHSDDDLVSAHPLLPLDDRIWRHPSEVASSMHANRSTTPPTSVSVSVTNKRSSWPALSAAGLFGACMAVGFLSVTGWVHINDKGRASSAQAVSSAERPPISPVAAWLGIETGEAESADAATMATLLTTAGMGSAIIFTVTAHSPAESAGLKVGDVIVAVGGASTTSAQDVATRLSRFTPGQSTTISVYRTGKPVEISVRFATHPQNE